MYEKVSITLPKLIWFLQRCHHQGTMTEKRSEGTLIKCMKTNKTRNIKILRNHPVVHPCSTVSSYMRIITDAVVLIRLHKKADLLEIKVNFTKGRKVHADEISFELGKMDTICLVIQGVGRLLWLVRRNYIAIRAASYAWGIILQ